MYGLECARNSDDGWFSLPKIVFRKSVALGKAWLQHSCAASPTADLFFSIMLLTVYSWKTLAPCGWLRERLSNSLWVKRGGLSLTSVSLTVTVVVPDNPPRWPPMSLAWSSTRYWSWVSLSISGTAVRRIPGEHTHTNSDIRVAMVHLKQRKIRFLLWRNATKWP